MALCLMSSLTAQVAQTQNYLDNVKLEMENKWPNNRTVNVVFHGHSVPSGYWSGGVVKTLEAYPHLTLVNIKSQYPYAVVNVITTSVGGENAAQGARRFTKDVLPLKPDVLFIDYALNDRKGGLKIACVAWEKMIKEAKLKGIKVVVMTPTPDTKEDIRDDNTPLAQHAMQIRQLAEKYNVGLVDSYQCFKTLVEDGGSISAYMAQNNHPNEKGHKLVSELITDFFNR